MEYIRSVSRKSDYFGVLGVSQLEVSPFGLRLCVLTHCGRVTHICVSKLSSIVSDSGLSPGRRQAIIWTNAGILLIRSLGTNFSEILIEIHTFSFKKMWLKRCRLESDGHFLSASMCWLTIHHISKLTCMFVACLSLYKATTNFININSSFQWPHAQLVTQVNWVTIGSGNGAQQ